MGAKVKPAVHRWTVDEIEDLGRPDETTLSNAETGNWIAIEPPHRAQTPPSNASTFCQIYTPGDASVVQLPTFDESQFDIILRRQRVRSRGGLKFTNVPSRFLNLSNDFEFAGWGTASKIALTADEVSHGNDALKLYHSQQVLGQVAASALAANDILGGMFYTLPSVFAVAGVYSPIAIFIATWSLFLWRPIMEELDSALPISGAPYTYLSSRLNVSTKSIALVGASLFLLDSAATAVASASTAIAYLAGEVRPPFPTYVGTLLVFVLFAAIGLAGLRESARVASGVLTFHITTVMVLFVASFVTWGSHGSSQLWANWVAGRATQASPVGILRQIFDGVCVGMLGLTGFECAPAYTAKMRPGSYPTVLRNLHLSPMILCSTMALLVLASLPIQDAARGNVLSILAEKVPAPSLFVKKGRTDILEQVAGRWLRIWVALDAVIKSLKERADIGIISACELLCELSRDRVLPHAFRAQFPLTGAPYLAILSFVTFSAAIYASTGANLAIISAMFSVVWLAVMALFPVSLVLLRFSRPRLPRASQCSLAVIVGSILVAAIVFAGNVAMNPSIAGWFSLYFLVLCLGFSIASNKVAILRWIYWAYDQVPLLHECRLTRGWGDGLIAIVRRLKRQPICLLVKTDEINHLFNMILYVRQNEETSHLSIIHFHKGSVPSELEANAKILDEAFPEITIDLVLVEGSFTPQNVAALAHRLNTSTSLMFMSCPGPNLPHPVAEFVPIMGATALVLYQRLVLGKPQRTLPRPDGTTASKERADGAVTGQTGEGGSRE
ncbi:hypothetical protein ID866_2078 [Astraeus odoratus]|nr:hypothetical protein ID866_2078 [Astraeus odoratus]